VRVNGVRIHFVSGGIGPPFSCCTAIRKTHVMWHRVAPALAARFNVICPDLRGYGDSGTVLGFEPFAVLEAGIGQG
jgi:haloacetate dehalogenase